MGAKVKTMNAYVAAAMQHEWSYLNSKFNPNIVPMVSGKHKWIFKMRCKEGQQHYGYKTIGSVHAKQSALDCYRCFPQIPGKPSSHELKAYTAIELAQEQMHPTARKFGLWVCEAKVVHGKSSSPVDIVFLEHNFVCQIDGEQHFCGKMHRLPSALMQERDKAFDAAAWDASFRLLSMF